MFWQENTTATSDAPAVTIADWVFPLQGRAIPVDHAYALAEAIFSILPWARGDLRLGIHSIHVAGSQNGWERPAPGGAATLQLSQRARLVLRMPYALGTVLAPALAQQTLEIAGYRLTVGTARPRALDPHSTLLARQVARADDDESSFLHAVADELAGRGVRIRKALCGKTLFLSTPNGTLRVCSLLLADLSLEEALQLQRQGLGVLPHWGCGLFQPHKSIAPVLPAVDGRSC